MRGWNSHDVFSFFLGINFDLLDCDNVKRVVLCGTYVNDLALRFDYSSVPADKIVCCASIPEAAELLKKDGSEPIYVVTCFSDRDKLLTLTQIEA